MGSCLACMRPKTAESVEEKNVKQEKVDQKPIDAVPEEVNENQTNELANAGDTDPKPADYVAKKG